MKLPLTKQIYAYWIMWRETRELVAISKKPVREWGVYAEKQRPGGKHQSANTFGFGGLECRTKALRFYASYHQCYCREEYLRTSEFRYLNQR